MKYPQIPDVRPIWEILVEYANLKSECGADLDRIQESIDNVDRSLKQAMAQIKSLSESESLRSKEPDGYEQILAARPGKSRVLRINYSEEEYMDRLSGAFLGRMAGCTLGAPVEGWSLEDMADWAAYLGDEFPPRDYWTAAKNPSAFRYNVSRFADYTRPKLNAVPVDDDVTYTILGLLIAEEYGRKFTTADVGKAWLQYVPLAYTAEAVALSNLKNNIPAAQAAEINNPFCQWIGADIRSDPWGYLAPGNPQEAARMAYSDAYLSHRRNGIYGEMYFSAVIAAAFAVDNAEEALKLGLEEIPAECLLARDIKWALATGSSLQDYREAKEAVDRRFAGMSKVHTNNNACLTIFGLMLGKDDFTRVIGDTVAMGYDNDCTAATAGSIAGAVYGRKSIPEHWYACFNNKVLTYLNGKPEFAIDDLVRRFARLASRQ